MLLQKIKNDEILSQFTAKKCEENNIEIILDKKITDDRHLIVKVDDYYNSLPIANRPKSPDCLILQKCLESNLEYAVTIVELKRRRKSSDFNINEVIEKYRTCLDDFMKIKFKDYFDKNYKRIDLYFVTNKKTYGSNDIDTNLELELSMSERIKFNGKYCIIKLCNNKQKVKPCYSK